MEWGEAMRLAELLLKDPSSEAAASTQEWEHSVSREALILMDQFDLNHAVNAKKRPKPHPGRPWHERTPTLKRGNAAGRTPEQTMALLREQFGQPEAPV